MKYIVLLSVLILSVSSKAYSFEVSNTLGERVNLKEMLASDKWTLIMLWQLNCVPCEKQKPAVMAFHSKYKSTQLKIIGLNIDGHKQLAEIKRYLETSMKGLQHFVAFSDVFTQQMLTETGKPFGTSPSYLLYSSDAELSLALNRAVDINELLRYLETLFEEQV